MERFASGLFDMFSEQILSEQFHSFCLRIKLLQKILLRRYFVMQGFYYKDN